MLGHASFLNSNITHFLFLFHVPLFFFISGYLEKVEPCLEKEYLKKIFFSLIVPYFIWNILFVPFHLSLKSFGLLLLGLQRWNGASWFLVVLVFLKINFLFYKNKKYVIGGLVSILLLGLHFCGNNLPYLINLTFMFLPFFFVGMYGKKILNVIYGILIGKTVWKVVLSLISFSLLLLVYRYMPVEHTNAVSRFAPHFYLFWISGFLGIFGVFFICLCFATLPKFIIVVSTSTLFIMCSHYELFRFLTPRISNGYGDLATFFFVCLFFMCQSYFSQFVLKYIPILAGRKKRKK